MSFIHRLQKVLQRVDEGFEPDSFFYKKFRGVNDKNIQQAKEYAKSCDVVYHKSPDEEFPWWEVVDSNGNKIMYGDANDTFYLKVPKWMGWVIRDELNIDRDFSESSDNKDKTSFEDRVVKVIERKGLRRLKSIFSQVLDKITPENLPRYYPDAEDGIEFEWEEVPYFCANIEDDLTEYFGEPVELCFSSDNGWYFVSGHHYLDELKLDDLETDYFGNRELINSLPNNYVGKVDAINPEPFEEAAMEEYYNNI